MDGVAPARPAMRPAPIVRTVHSPAPRNAWREVIAASPDATIFQTPEWLDACTAAGPVVDASRLYETADGTRIVVPAVRRVVRGASIRSRDRCRTAGGSAAR